MSGIGIIRHKHIDNDKFKEIGNLKVVQIIRTIKSDQQMWEILSRNKNIYHHKF